MISVVFISSLFFFLGSTAGQKGYGYFKDLKEREEQGSYLTESGIMVFIFFKGVSGV